MNDAANMKTKLVSVLTTTEIVIGEDRFLMDTYENYDEDIFTTTIMERQPGIWVEVVDDKLKDWLITATEAHEREGSPF
jgi:hypothetical protein